MVRKMAYAGFSYLLGLFTASFIGSWIYTAAGAAFTAVLAVVLIFFDKTRRKLYFCIIFFCTGALFYSAYDRMVYDNTVKYNNITIEMDGVISDHDEYAKDIDRYRIKGMINGSVKAEIFCYGSAKRCNTGDRIYVKGKASVPKVSYIFDSKGYYKAKGIYLIINSADEINITPADELPVKRILCRYRDYICSVMSRQLKGESEAVLRSILFGDKSDLEDSTRTLLSRAGIAHVMAVSGIHLAIVCSLFGCLIKLLPVNKYIRFFLMLIPMFLFVMLSGASRSVLRAAVMLILVYAAGLFDRRADVMNSLGIAAVVLTLPCPFAVRDASFMLSFAGVIGIGAVYPAAADIIKEKRGKELGMFAKPFIASACVTTVIFPVSFMFFDEISVVSPVTNIILMPFCTVILICGVLTAATGGLLAVPLMKICGICCNIVLGASKLIGGFQLSYIPLGYKFTVAAAAVSLAAAVAAFAVIRNVRKAAAVSSALFGLCIVSVMIYRFLPSDHISAAVLTDGRGAASIVIHDKKNASVIDLNKGGKTAGHIVKYLTRNGIGRIELLALTVDDNTSETVYMKAFELFDVGTVIVPSGINGSERDVFFAANTMTYDSSRECTVEMPDYTMVLSENNTVALTVNGYTVIAYNGKKQNNIAGRYDAVIDYAGKSPSEDIRGDVIIFADSEAEASVSKDSTAYIGENAVIKIYDNKIGTEVISCGIGY